MKYQRYWDEDEISCFMKNKNHKMKRIYVGFFQRIRYVYRSLLSRKTYQKTKKQEGDRKDIALRMAMVDSVK
jgi:hypothetical protein